AIHSYHLGSSMRLCRIVRVFNDRWSYAFLPTQTSRQPQAPTADRSGIEWPGVAPVAPPSPSRQFISENQISGYCNVWLFRRRGRGGRGGGKPAGAGRKPLNLHETAKETLDKT